MSIQRKTNPAEALKPASRRKWVIGVMALLVWAGLVVIGFWLGRPDPESTLKRSPVTPPGDSKLSAAVVRPKTDERLQKILGRWVRPDGGYILEIRGIEDNGRLEASYYNPNPVNVARAEASADASSVRVFIELRDVNYPGATYKLTYGPNDDRLTGEYYQPKLGQTFKIGFLRSRVDAR